MTELLLLDKQKDLVLAYGMIPVANRRTMIHTMTIAIIQLKKFSK